MSERVVVLKNTSRNRCFQATMFHDIVCAKRQQCTCAVVHPGGKALPIRNPASFRIEAGATSEELPYSVLLIPQVDKALKGDNAWLKIVSDQAKVETL